MKLIIIGSGRMGIRHLLGALKSLSVSEITVFDINQNSIDNAINAINDNKRKEIVSYICDSRIDVIKSKFDIAIIASTANDRKALLKSVISLNVKRILIEKPLGQSLEEVEELEKFTNDYPGIKFDVNLNMRMYKGFIDLKNDLNNLTQLEGTKRVTVNTGSLGIGANGIHYIDLLFYLFNADNFEIKYAEIDDFILPSGRGKQFGDFGGIANVDFLKGEECVGKGMLSITSESTVFGGWEFVASNGRVSIDELKGIRSNHYRKADSNLPVNRYAGDYLAPTQLKFEVPELSEITTVWLNEAYLDNDTLPNLKESLISHRLMFEWLNHTDKYSKVFPIT